jgi:hypothetical protein
MLRSWSSWPRSQSSPAAINSPHLQHVAMPASRAYARKMEPDPKETPDFTAFSKMRRIPLDPESVIGRELHDRFAEFDESFTGHSRIWCDPATRSNRPPNDAPERTESLSAAALRIGRVVGTV